MQASAMPACCTAIVVHDFGESEVADGNISGGYNPAAEDINSYLGAVERQWKKEGFAFICATTNNEQTVANKVLFDRGYICSSWMSKDKHPETTVALWHLPLHVDTDAIRSTD